MITVSKLVTERKQGGVLMIHQIQGLHGISDLRYFVETGEHLTKLPDNSDSALVALIYPAMLAGKALHFEGCVSDELLFKINNDVMPLLRAREARLNVIKVTAAQTYASALASYGKGAGTGYSAGVDSFATLELYSERNAPASHQISHLALFDNTDAPIGEFPNGLVQRAHLYSQLKGMPLTKISSNVEDVIRAVDPKSRTDSYIQTHSIRSAASAYLLAAELRRYVFSGSYDYRLIKTTPTHDMAYVDPILMPLLSTSAFELISGCAGMRRLDKMLLIADSKDAHRHLHVCIRRTGSEETHNKGRGSPEYINCSSCWKCARAMFTLEVASALKKFKHVFDLEYFDANRMSFVFSLRDRVRKGDAQAVDALNFAEEHGGIKAYKMRRLTTSS